MRAVRNLQGMTLPELGEFTRTHPQSLRNIELENKPASEELIAKIAWALHVDPYVLMRNPPKVGEEPAEARSQRHRCFRSQGAA